MSNWTNGLPPVGEVCEFRKTNTVFRYDFVKAEVLFISDQLVVLQHCASKNHFSVLVDEVEFRPLKSEAELKREKAVEQLMSDAQVEHPCGGNYGVTFAVAERLLDNGYRKVNELTDEHIFAFTGEVFATSSTRVSWINGAKWARSQIMGEDS